MSVRFERSNTESASSGDDFWGGADTAFTIGFWLYITSLPSSGEDCIISFDDDSFSGWVLQVTSAGVLELVEEGTPQTSTGSTLSTATWYYVWMTRDGTGFFGNVDVFLDGSTSADISDNGNFAGTGPCDIAVNNTSTGAAGTLDGRILDPKTWDAEVAASNADAEKAECDHQATANAYSEWLMDDHTTDLSDEGPGSRDLTASGTLSTEANEGSWSCGGAATAIQDIIGGTGIIPFAR